MTQSQVDEFAIDGVKFRLKPLPVLVAEKLAPAVVGMVTPAFTAFIAGQTNVAELGKALQGLVGSAEQLPKFREAFAPQCQVTIGVVDGVDVWSDLRGDTLEKTFRRKHRLYFEWIGQCISVEYGAFLAEIGQRLTAALKANHSTSQPGSPGESGDSPPTPESKTDSPQS